MVPLGSSRPGWIQRCAAGRARNSSVRLRHQPRRHRSGRPPAHPTSSQSSAGDRRISRTFHRRVKHARNHTIGNRVPCERFAAKPNHDLLLGRHGWGISRIVGTDAELTRRIVAPAPQRAIRGQRTGVGVGRATIAQVCPEETTRAGVLFESGALSPSCPELLLPQHQSVPSSIMAQVWTDQPTRSARWCRRPEPDRWLARWGGRQRCRCPVGLKGCHPSTKEFHRS